MTFHKTKRAVALAVAASWLVLCIAGKEGEGKEKSRLNSIRLSGAYSFHLLRHRNSQTTGEPLHTREHLGGFEISYERELIEDAPQPKTTGKVHKHC
jgi:hypothetical protein